MPGDFFRYTVDGAIALFKRAGLEVVLSKSRRQWRSNACDGGAQLASSRGFASRRCAELGDSRITSGYVMGFGADARLGSGAFGSCFLVRQNASGEEMVMNEVPLKALSPSSDEPLALL